MKYQKNFNDLSTSIAISLLFVASIAGYVLMVHFGFLHPRAGTNPILTLIIGTLLFVFIILGLLFAILFYCYEYWYFDNDVIYSKKLFRKKVIIKMNEIEKVEIKTKKVMMWTEIVDIDAYIIYSKDKKIEIPIFSDDCLIELEYALRKFIK